MKYYTTIESMTQAACAIVCAAAIGAGTMLQTATHADAIDLQEPPQIVGTMPITATITEQALAVYHAEPIKRARGVPPESITSQVNEDAESNKEPELTYTERDLELLACVIYCEAGSDTISDETRRMVGEVVLNRVASEAYPDTIEAVLIQRGQYGTFSKTGVVWPARASRSVEAHAVERAYDCARAVFTEDRLLPEDVIYQAGFVQGEIVASAPGFYFCR